MASEMIDLRDGAVEDWKQLSAIANLSKKAATRAAFIFNST
jgi:hypothetical protein